MGNVPSNFKWLKLKIFHGLSGIDIGNYWVRFFFLIINGEGILRLVRGRAYLSNAKKT